MKKAFTLVELLIVIAIMAILCAVISGNVMKYKEAKAKCKDRQVQSTKTQSTESTTTYTIVSE
jgi:prepilin-type N-terminal cleavage/methylation domain-containing protein